jgi:hypothetical protein
MSRVKAKDNPFASARIEKLGFRFPPGTDWERFLRRLEDMNWTASIVGAHGSGKTTLIEQLIPRLKKRGFEPVLFQLRTESSNAEKDALADLVRKVVKPGFVLLDGAEQLSTHRWLSVRSAAGLAAGLLVTVHRASRLPPAVQLDATPGMLESLVDELTGGKLPPGESQALLSRHFGNVRECFRELYDRYAG